MPPIDFRLTGLTALEPYRQSVLARDCVRYVGEPVAAVFAEDPYVAEDAAELVELEIEALRSLLDADGAAGRVRRRTHDTEATVSRRDTATSRRLSRAAHAVVELDLTIGRHSGVPLETRGAIARYDAARDVLEMHGAAKVPHWNRDTLARMFGRAPDGVQLYGAMSAAASASAARFIRRTCWSARPRCAFGRPVKWIEDRREHLMAANHSRQQHHRIRAAVDAEGRILAIDDEFFHDQGAYVRTQARDRAGMSPPCCPGPIACRPTARSAISG